MVKRRFLATSSPCMSFLLTLLQTTLRRNPWRMLERNLKICLDKCTMRSLKRRISGTVMQQCNLNVANIQTISTKSLLDEKDLEMFYLNTIEQLFLFVEQLDQLEVYLPYTFSFSFDQCWSVWTLYYPKTPCLICLMTPLKSPYGNGELTNRRFFGHLVD